jgi:hypothetical protein
MFADGCSRATYACERGAGLRAVLCSRRVSRRFREKFLKKFSTVVQHVAHNPHEPKTSKIQYISAMLLA